MQLTMFESVEDCPLVSSSGKTSPESSAQRTTPSGAFWLGLPEKMTREKAREKIERMREE